MANTSLYDTDGASHSLAWALVSGYEDTLRPWLAKRRRRCRDVDMRAAGHMRFNFRLHGVCSSIRVELALPSFSPHAKALRCSSSLQEAAAKV